MAKAKKVNINEIVDKADECFNVLIESSNKAETIEVEVKKSIPLNDYSKMMSEILDMIFDFKKGEYHAEYTNFAINYNFIKYFTNVNTSNKAKIFDFICKTDILHKINVLIEPDYAIIVDEVNQAIDFAKRTIFKASPWDSVAHRIDELLSQLDTVANNISGIDKETLEKGINLLGSITKDDIKDMVIKKMEADGQS